VRLLQRSIDGAAPEENDETARDEDRKSADARADFPRDRTSSTEDFVERGHDESFSTVWSERRQKEGHASGAKGARSRDG